MKLIYDIAVMAQLVAACESANTEIVKAEQLVQQVRSHSDWTCKEKSVIDELMQECKQLVQRMREDQSSFLRVLKDVEGELNDTENSVSNLFSGVESILGKVLGIPVAVAHVAGGGLLGAVSAIGQTPFGNAVSQALNQWTEGIDIQNQMMDQFNPDHVGTGWAGDLIEKMKEIGEDILDTDVIWHGPPQIGIPSSIIDSVNNIGGIGASIGGDAISWGGVLDNVGSVVSDIGSGISGVAEKITSGLGVSNGIPNVLDELRENVLQGRTEYNPWSQNPNLVQDALEQVQDVGNTIGSVVTDAIPVAIPVGQWVSDVAGNVWGQVQDSPIGDAVADALRNITESIAVCNMSDLII